MMLAWDFLKAATLSKATSDWINPQVEYPTEPGQTTLGQFDWRGMFQNPGPYISPSGRPEAYQQRQEELAQQHREGMQPIMNNKELEHSRWAEDINEASTKHKDILDFHGYPETHTQATQILNAVNNALKGDSNRDVTHELYELSDNLARRHQIQFPKESVQTELGNFLGFPSRVKDPIAMIRLERQRRQSQDKLLQTMKEGVVPYPQGRGQGEEDYQGFERNTGRAFPLLEKPGVFSTGANLHDIANITTGTSLGEDPLIWGIRQNPQDIDAFMRNPDEAPEELNEIFIREGIDPSRLVRFPSFKGSAEKTNITSSHDIKQELKRYSSHAVPPLRAALDAEGQPITFDLDNAGLNEEEKLNVVGNVGEKNIDILDRDIDRLPIHIQNKLWASLEKDGHNKGDIRRWKNNTDGTRYSRGAHDWAVKSGLPRFSTSDVNFPTNEHHWPIHHDGTPFTIHELNAHRQSIDDATKYLRSLHMQRRPPEFGEMGQEFTTQPASREERDRWEQQGLITEDESRLMQYGGTRRSYDEDGNTMRGAGYGKYSPELWDKIREIRESERNEPI